MPLILKQRRYLLLIFFLFPFAGNAQRVFVKTIQGVNRSYLFYSNSIDDDRHANKPVVIMLHSEGSDARSVYSQTAWDKLKENAILIFPNANNKNWLCEDTAAVSENKEFLHVIISELYHNFHNDRNRIFILGDKKSDCLVTDFKETYPDILIKNSITQPDDFKDSLSAVSLVSRMLRNSAVQADTLYKLWEDPLARKPMDVLDSLKQYRRHNRMVFELRTGGFAMLGLVKTGISDGTYTNLAKSHSFFDIHFSKWMNDSVAWFVDIGRLKVPRNQETTDSGVRTGGGSVMPITLGFKYAPTKIKWHPYFLLGSGIIQIMVMGGKMSATASTTSRPKMNGEMRMVFHTTLGTGVDLRLSKRLTLGGHLRYIHSAHFESAGKVNAIRGFNLNAGLGYIINANSTKNLPFSINPKKK